MAGVSFDSVEANAAFAKKQEFPFPLLSDPDRSMGLSYGACKEATDPFAERISYIISGDGVVLKSYPSVSVMGHAAAVLDALRRDFPEDAEDESAS